MRMLLTVEMDTTTSNEAIQQGTLLQTMEGALQNLRPEAAYFTVQNGRRTAYIFFDLTDTAQMPKISEPFFMGTGAKVSFCPVMNAGELREGLSSIMPS
ncbi:hypothetical protein ACFW2Y_15105 [Streptomyces sp. NPDC058877]|uniref:hypothetical protein n=1 Tax=unclassified Streptomyces TaxID=2593676 RepID=UPI0036BEB9FF